MDSRRLVYSCLLTLGLVAASASVFVACNPEEPAHPSVHYSGLCAPGFDSTDEKPYHISYPRGGEVLKVGSVQTLGICTEDTGGFKFGSATSPLSLSIDGGRTWYSIECTYAPGLIYWTVPESLYSGVTNRSVSTVSSACLLHIEAYQGPGYYADSDSLFSIVK